MTRGVGPLLAWAWAAVFLAMLSGPASQASTPTPRKGWDFAGIPLINFTTDRGVGYGAYLGAYYHGPDGAGALPYRASIGGQFYQTNRGYAFHKLLVDVPNLWGTGARFDLKSGYETWDGAWYFGVGNTTPRVPPEDTPAAYYTSGLKSLWAIPTLRLPVRPRWSLLFNYVFRRTTVNVIGGSRLAEDAPVGTEGGVLSVASVGLAYDSRDREPTPTRGLFSEGSIRLAHPVIGAEWRGYGANLTHRQWARLGRDDLVLAYRVGLDWTGGEHPFFQQHILGGTAWVELGGKVALRGLPNGRYRGPIIAYGNLEIRYTLGRVHWGDRTFDLLAVPFVDLARVWGGRSPDGGLGLHGSAGGGGRLVYNEVFVVRFDVGAGVEEYTDADTSNGYEVRRRGPVFGVYAVIGHPF